MPHDQILTASRFGRFSYRRATFLLLHLGNAIMNTFYVIYSNTSRNGMAGLRPQVMRTSDKNIIAAAEYEMRRSGESLEDLAGIDWIEDADGNMTPARDLTCDEVLALSVKTLGDDGRMYYAFATDEAAAFIEAAEDNGMGDEARAIVENFNSEF